MESLIKFVQDEFVTKKEIPSFKSGDTITVYYEIREGEKVRTQFFKGVVIQIKGHIHYLVALPKQTCLTPQKSF